MLSAATTETGIYYLYYTAANLIYNNLFYKSRQ